MGGGVHKPILFEKLRYSWIHFLSQIKLDLLVPWGDFILLAFTFYYILLVLEIDGLIEIWYVHQTSQQVTRLGM